MTPSQLKTLFKIDCRELRQLVKENKLSTDEWEIKHTKLFQRYRKDLLSTFSQQGLTDIDITTASDLGLQLELDRVCSQLNFKY